MIYLMHAYHLKGKVNFFTKFGQNISFSQADSLSRKHKRLYLVSCILADVLTEKGNPHWNPGSFVPFGALDLHAKPAERRERQEGDRDTLW